MRIPGATHDLQTLLLGNPDFRPQMIDCLTEHPGAKNKNSGKTMAWREGKDGGNTRKIALFMVE